MRIILNYYCLFFLLCVASSCTKNLYYVHAEERTTECVNSMTIQWANEVSEDKKQIILDIVNDMVKVDGGYFTMGVNVAYDSYAKANESPAHNVKLSDYYICAHELTTEQLACFDNSNVHITYRGNHFYYSFDSWKAFIELLNYYTGLNFDFPTEAQWEFAARGGILSKGYLYPGSNNREDVWSEGEVGSSFPNELGLFNMADGRAEWCKDKLDKYRSDQVLVNPCVLSGKYQVVRGGCSHLCSYDRKISNLNDCRSTARSNYYGSVGNNDITCRLVINLGNEE